MKRSCTHTHTYIYIYIYIYIWPDKIDNRNAYCVSFVFICELLTPLSVSQTIQDGSQLNVLSSEAYT
jgi:hypothetical protein